MKTVLLRALALIAALVLTAFAAACAKGTGGSADQASASAKNGRGGESQGVRKVTPLPDGGVSYEDAIYLLGSDRLPCHIFPNDCEDLEGFFVMKAYEDFELVMDCGEVPAEWRIFLRSDAVPDLDEVLRDAPVAEKTGDSFTVKAGTMIYVYRSGAESADPLTLTAVGEP